MGWAKYAEDNFEIYLERMENVRNDYKKQEVNKNAAHVYKEQVNKKDSNFSQWTTEKSCFSLN